MQCPSCRVCLAVVVNLQELVCTVLGSLPCLGSSSVLSQSSVDSSFELCLSGVSL